MSIHSLYLTKCVMSIIERGVMPVNISKVLEIPHLIFMERMLLFFFDQVVINSQMQAEY